MLTSTLTLSPQIFSHRAKVASSVLPGLRGWSGLTCPGPNRCNGNSTNSNSFVVSIEFFYILPVKLGFNGQVRKTTKTYRPFRQDLSSRGFGRFGQGMSHYKSCPSYDDSLKMTQIKMPDYLGLGIRVFITKQGRKDDQSNHDSWHPDSKVDGDRHSHVLLYHGPPYFFATELGRGVPSILSPRCSLGSQLNCICWWEKHMSHEKNPYYFPLYWLVNRDPYSGLF